MKLYQAEHYSYDGETHTTTLGIYESSALAWQAVNQLIAEKQEIGEYWYITEDFDVVEYELNKRIWL